MKTNQPTWAPSPNLNQQVSKGRAGALSRRRRRKMKKLVLPTDRLGTFKKETQEGTF
jgi:hypothetical protein